MTKRYAYKQLGCGHKRLGGLMGETERTSIDVGFTRHHKYSVNEGGVNCS